jgi:hypothetical protein
MGFDMRHITDADLARIDVDRARQVYRDWQFPAQANSLAPWEGQLPPLGTWKVDPLFGEFEVLTEIPLDEVTPGEPEDMIKLWEGYPLYVQWAREGRPPPPVTVVRHVDGHLVSCNRRRVLAARDAGVRTIVAWFSETGAAGRTAWRLPRDHYALMPVGATVWTERDRYVKVPVLLGERHPCTRSTCEGELNAVDSRGELAHICPVERVYTTFDTTIRRDNAWRSGSLANTLTEATATSGRCPTRP